LELGFRSGAPVSLQIHGLVEGGEVFLEHVVVGVVAEEAAGVWHLLIGLDGPRVAPTRRLAVLGVAEGCLAGRLLGQSGFFLELVWFWRADERGRVVLRHLHGSQASVLPEQTALVGWAVVWLACEVGV